jgi:hypothetical protein
VAGLVRSILELMPQSKQKQTLVNTLEVR